MSAVVAMPPVKPGDQSDPERFAGGPGRGRVPVHPDRRLRGIAAPARRLLGVSTYQANKLLVIRAAEHGLSALSALLSSGDDVVSRFGRQAQFRQYRRRACSLSALAIHPART